MFKYIILLLVCSSFLCGQVSIITSTPNQAFLVKEIGKDKVKVESLLKPREDMHFLDVNPVFMNKLYFADIFVETGLGAEPWVLPLLQGAKNRKILRQNIGNVNAARGIAPLGIPSSISRDLGDVHPQGNPHYLLDPVNSKIVAGNIYKTLIRIAPQHTNFFKQNLISYNKKLRSSLIKWLKKVKPHKGKIKFVSYHELWPYFSRRFGLVQIGTIEPKPGIQPSSRHIQNLIAQMKAQNCRLIIVAKIYPLNQVRYIAEKTGAKIIHASIEVEKKDGYLAMIDELINGIIPGE
ncbi:metal ABC transporter substrate-binding protein [Candidatus Uabimicrobium sp. HlEnr_7]|uniref:metal ABC transporter substrate-binding protein n=1 Tax=Candidatus Uabimicrobium helgolandensis TaxID=3095367 RepID=UPI003558422A